MLANRVFVAVLAAGLSRRFGSPKQLHNWRGRPLVQHALDTATSACGDDVLLVLGHAWQPVLEAAADAPFVTLNEEYKKGMGTTISVATKTLRGRADAIIIMPVDQPLVTPDHLVALIGKWSGNPDEIVATRYAGIDGTPTLFARGAFDRLVALDSHRGARVLFGDEQFSVQSIAFADAAFDIDTPADFEQRSQFTQPESPST